MYLIFDTETTGLPKNYNAPITDLDNWPRLVQLAWQLHGAKGELLNAGNHIVKPDGFTIPYNSEKIHGISTQMALEMGKPLKEVLEIFAADVAKAGVLVGHNVEFDINVMGAEFIRGAVASKLLETAILDTKEVSTDFCAIPGGRGGKFKWPTLTELHTKLFGEGFGDAHDAAYDVHATTRCFFGLISHQVVKPFDATPYAEIVYEAPELDAANFAKRKEEPKDGAGLVLDKAAAKKIDSPFSHLHVHTQYSILQATPNIKNLVKKTKELGMKAVAMTDHGNMFGAFIFVKEALAAELKPIVGCEFYVAEERTTLKFTKDNPDKRFNQVLLAKNKTGYHNLAKLSSLAYMEGNYGQYPRIDKDLICQYREGVIATTGGLDGEIPGLILNVGEGPAEDAFKWWHECFGDDFYVQLQRHGLDEENKVNEVLLGFARKYGVKYFAANNVYYLDKADAGAHDVLLCVRDGEMQSTPIGRGRGYRFGFPNQEFYLKSEDEMKALFADLPEAIECTQEIVDKIETYKLQRDVLLPKFDIPAEFRDPLDEEDGGKRGENNYLRHLTYEGARKRYAEITPEIQERLDFELETIAKTGYPGYFLIVQDFTNKAREMGVAVGPGRGSAAGSAVAYCIGITNVDPIAYDLLFERFLNPDRVSLPDIDIDFDDEGRGAVIDYVVKKYGQNQVSQIITYGTMAAKSAIRDCARVMELPLQESNELAKMVPEKPGTTLAKAFKEVPELKAIRDGRGLRAEVLKQAEILEGSLRNTGIHACGVIITPDDITKYIPVATSKDAALVNTQFDNSVVESAGMLKMDFLGLKTLSIIKTAIQYIKKRHGVTIDPDTIPLDDEKTYELYQRGETNGTFQFESPGMQKHLRNLKPDKFEDLIAMNALYRPGPLEYIPNFIARKHGREPITYDIPAMDEYLGETYGITVYQEQVMLLSQSLAGFSKGDADVLRKAMGKKIFALLEKLKPKFVEGGKERGHDPKALEKVWKDWEAFAAYAFNKSHSTCYSVVAYHTAYLKAHYPAEYMASVLTHNQSNIEKVTFFMEECRNQGIKVLGPDVNESDVQFMVNDAGEIRFGLGAIKGAGEAAVEEIINERNKKGKYKDIFDFAKRVNLRAVNKKTFECLAMAGGFDCFEDCHRRQYLHNDEAGEGTLIELAIKWAQRAQQEEDSAQVSLFGGAGSGTVAIPMPRPPQVEPFGDLEKLRIEKEVVGFYLSGHPLDQFKLELLQFCNTRCSELNDLPTLRSRNQVTLGGTVTDVGHRMTKNGKPFGTLTLEDYEGSFTFYLFGEDYTRFKAFLTPGWFLHLTGSVQSKPWKEDDLEFKITNIQLLGDIRSKLAKTLKLKVPVQHISKELIELLEQVGSKFPGNCELKVSIEAHENGQGMEVELLSRKYRIDPSNDLFKQLDVLKPDVEYSLG
ncbi:DNA polymerase III subunit alpha [Cesiribacter sp. SM1]|uniref:DNA polymerase III subunit alpha n=1 Tax=Cesiribacter sp. SM1 TaxID=2861196 RepID=UPI001CD4903D|nr:DNA polymerase III subunit alpha [Cesiribacter sp. SM1]